MFDESLLDDPGALSRADTSALLRGTAEAGARVRNAARFAAEAGVPDLTPDGRPRCVLIAGPGPAPATVAGLIGALACCPVLAVPTGGAAPTTGDRRWTLPGWAGPLDLLLLATDDGREPGLTDLVERAYRRGCQVVAVAPAGGPLAEALTQARGLVLPYPPTPYRDPVPEPRAGSVADHRDPGVLWGLMVPLLALADRLGLLTAPPSALHAVADRLDTAAERFGPAAETYRNPAKTLTVELATALPLLWSEGPLAARAADRFAGLLAARAGRPALAAALPEAVGDHAALLTGEAGAAGAGGLDDFFRDRVEDPAAPRPRVVLLREPGGRSRTTAVAHDAAARHGVPLSAIDAPPGGVLESLAELLALTDFAAAYLALATGENRTP